MRFWMTALVLCFTIRTVDRGGKQSVLEGCLMAKMWMGVAGVVMLAGAVVGGAAQAKPVAYTVAAPLSEYFMEKAAEMEMARSAAPVSISGGAEVLAMGKDGYTTAAKGGNGFTCLVERGFAAGTDDPVFWNPKVRGPVCLNAAAVRTYLPRTEMKAKLALAGKTKEEIGRAVKVAVEKKELPVVEAGAMSYMMSKEQ
jgi:hypothetical protein